jgi:integrase
MLQQGLALPSINRKLSTIKVYAALAASAGVISGADLSLIKTVKGYAAKEFKRVDEKRTVTRIGDKKAKGAVLDDTQARQLKQQPDTPQGRRDAVIVCLLLDHGLRVGELAALQVTDVDLRTGQLRFYRPKVGKAQTHKLTTATLKALRAYLAADAPALGLLLRGSRKSGELAGVGMSERSISVRVGELGERIGIDDLSAHDLRHYWATRAIRKGADPFRVQQAGGWTSMQTVKKYVEETEIANEGIGDDEE